MELSGSVEEKLSRYQSMVSECNEKLEEEQDDYKKLEILHLYSPPLNSLARSTVNQIIQDKEDMK